MAYQFRFLSGDVNYQEYGGKFVSKRLNNTEFDYWLIMNVVNLHDAGDEKQDKYYVNLAAVAPSQVARKELDAAKSCCDFDAWGNPGDPLHLVEVLAEYGILAQLWQATGNNLRTLMKAARKEAQIIELLFGFYMDRPQNGLGATGWDCIAGNPWGALAPNKEQ